MSTKKEYCLALNQFPLLESLIPATTILIAKGIVFHECDRCHCYYHLGFFFPISHDYSNTQHYSAYA